MQNVKHRIAIYGKGGIGKSTVAVNTAILLAERGLRVALIGCDPKQDTVRLLTHRYVTSILDNYETILSDNAAVDDCVVRGDHGILCAEVGGPKPGVGCAGRGLILALDLLTKRKYLSNTDVVIFDVLGDVVCGGFATPVSRGYADEIYIVSSGEQAALYAANNILRGMCEIGKQVRGLILNAAGLEGESEVVRAFSELVQLPIAASLPHDPAIPKYELRGLAMAEAERGSDTCAAYETLCDYILQPHDRIENKPRDRKDFYPIMNSLWEKRG